jgi:hypothetical protein
MSHRSTNNRWWTSLWTRPRLFVSDTDGIVQQYAAGNTIAADAQPMRSWAVSTDVVIYLTVDDTTGTLYGLNSARSILRFSPNDGNVTTVATAVDFRTLWYGTNDTATYAFGQDIEPQAIAFDSNGKMFVAVVSQSNNAVLSVLTPSTVAQPVASLVQLNGSTFYSLGPYGRTDGTSEGFSVVRMYFSHGYLYLLEDAAKSIVRTQYPYTAFASAADLDTNPLVVAVKATWEHVPTGVLVHNATGTVFVAWSSGTLVQYTAVGDRIQLNPFESPCLADVTQLVSRFDDSYSLTQLALDDSASPARLYARDASNHLAWFNVTLRPALPLDAAGCLTPTQRDTWRSAVPLPPRTPAPSLAAQPLMTPLTGMAAALGLASVTALTHGSNGILFLAGITSTEAVQVVSYRPASTANGSGVVKLAT